MRLSMLRVFSRRAYLCAPSLHTRVGILGS